MHNSHRNSPIAKIRVGKFQISLWKRSKTIAARNDFQAERRFDVVRALVQYSHFHRTTETWENQSIWCNPEELRDLANALDQLVEHAVSEIAGHRGQTTSATARLPSLEQALPGESWRYAPRGPPIRYHFPLAGYYLEPQRYNRPPPRL